MASEETKREGRIVDPDAMAIASAKAAGSVIINRANQQLVLQNNMRLLERDVNRTLRLGRARIDNLGELERRVLQMRQLLKVPALPTVDERVHAKITRNDRIETDSRFTSCTRCQRRILKVLFEAHDKSCLERQGKLQQERDPIYDLNQDLKTQLTTFLPQPPRHIKLKAKGATFIEWEWLPCVFDGGLPVTDYEISYQMRSAIFDRLSGKYVFTNKSIPSLKTSMWCSISPVRHNGFKMVGLSASTEYIDFKIRCCNLRGWSEWIPMLSATADDPKSKLFGVVSSVTTDDPEPPSPPLFIRCQEVTSSCIYLDWQEPFYDGGSPIFEYIVLYTVVERTFSATSRDVFIESNRKLRIPDAGTKVILRNIPPDTDVINIVIKATNKAGLLGEPGHLDNGPEGPTEVLRTAECSRHQALLNKIRDVENTPGEYYDTDFVTGTQQRLLRVNFLDQLQMELAITPIDPQEEQEDKEWAVIQDTRRKKKATEEAERLRKQQEEESDLNLTSSRTARSDLSDSDLQRDELNDFVFPIYQRRAHYKYRLKLLEKRIEAWKEERRNIDTDRSKLTMSMQTLQSQQMDYKLERDRVMKFNGTIVTSSILHGASMQYQKEDFLIKITQAHDKCMADIAAAKFTIIKSENRKVKIKQLLEDAAEELKDRKAAHMDFEKTQERRMKAIQKLKNENSEEEKLKTAYKYFKKWISFLDDKKQLRDCLDILLQSLKKRYCKNAFHKWRDGQYVDSGAERVVAVSVGGKMLEKALEQRFELQAELREIVAGTNSLKQKMNMVKINRGMRNALLMSENLHNMEEGFNHMDMFASGMHYLFEGDGYAAASMFEAARQAYENQIWSLRSRPHVDIKMLAVCHGRMGRMFMEYRRYDRAIVEFDRQLSLAKEVDDQVELADGFFGLGSGYLARYDFDACIRYMNIAQAKYTALGNLVKTCEALRALKEAYKRIGRADISAQFDERLAVIEKETEKKVGKIGSSLAEMRDRLVVGSTATQELLVNIERTTLKGIRLKNRIDGKSDELDDYEVQLEEQQEKVEALEDLLNKIQKEIDAAFETDELEMVSFLVHETPQTVDVEELKTRLAARKTDELENFRKEKEEEAKILTSIRNIKDDIQDATDQLSLEEGPLMKRSRHDKPFRFVSFCVTNVAGNEVTGTATGGVEWFVAAEGPNIHCIDYHTGGIITVIAGGERPDTLEEKHDIVGHKGLVTCLIHDGNLFFSGSVDETIISWDADTKERIMTLLGHEGSIVSLAVEGPLLASASADSTTRIWDKVSGDQLRVVYGHSKSVLAMQMGSNWLLTGSADEDVRVWDIGKQGKKSKSLTVKCRNRLIGHDAAVTAVSYGKLEVITGDCLGRIFIWWMETGQILRKCEVHKGAVKCLQFDACHIVSGGCDSNLCITDIATGDVMSTLRGHTHGHILALAFDTERIISVGGDNTLRFWKWGKKTGPTDKTHVLDKGQTLVDVSKLYEVPVRDLMKWNGIIEMRHAYPGMKLIVKKANPDALTGEELAAQEKAHRREGGKVGKNGEVVMSAEHAAAVKLLKFDRVKRQANDLDKHSVANRLFSKEKKEFEIFPNAFDTKGNSSNLASRLKRSKDEMLKHLETLKTPTAPFFIMNENEHVWGPVADALGLAMMSMLVEYEAYSVVGEVRAEMRDKQTIQGRIGLKQSGYHLVTDDEAGIVAAVNTLDRSRRSSRASSRHTSRPSTSRGSSLKVGEDLIKSLRDPDHDGDPDADPPGDITITTTTTPLKTNREGGGAVGAAAAVAAGEGAGDEGVSVPLSTTDEKTKKKRRKKDKTKNKESSEDLVEEDRLRNRRRSRSAIRRENYTQRQRSMSTVGNNLLPAPGGQDQMELEEGGGRGGEEGGGGGRERGGGRDTTTVARLVLPPIPGASN